jgi:hypothetical protein
MIYSHFPECHTQEGLASWRFQESWKTLLTLGPEPRAATYTLIRVSLYLMKVSRKRWNRHKEREGSGSYKCYCLKALPIHLSQDCRLRGSLQPSSTSIPAVRNWKGLEGNVQITIL